MENTLKFTQILRLGLVFGQTFNSYSLVNHYDSEIIFEKQHSVVIKVKFKALPVLHTQNK